MDKNFISYQELSKSCTGCNNVTAPSCINDDYCVATPMPRNGGILAMAFVDMQPIESVYSESDAFCNGTLFPNLNMPFYGGKRK